MSRFHSHIKSAEAALQSYQPGTPFALHLKLFFQADKKFGSKDRKSIASLCYSYLRCYHLVKDLQKTEEKFIRAVFLCENEPSDLLQELSPAHNELIGFGLADKLDYLGLNAEDAFHFNDMLSPMIEQLLFVMSLFQQPDLHLRIRPGKKEMVTDGLKKHQIPFQLIGEASLVMENGINLENVMKFDKDVVVQDLSSQQVFDFFKKEWDGKRTETLWDCCAASGGKSILLHDICKGAIKITVSDVRDNILANLQLRFKDAGITVHKKMVQDLSLKSGLLLNEKFSLIVCDAPCSGSGTWSRTPEQHVSFKNEMLSEFTSRQKSIVNHIMPHLARDGWFVYITCSVFEAENESIVNYIEENFSCRLMEMKYIKGYQRKSDTMFVAYFKN